jgi:phosphoribosylamine--glycine ligase
MKFLLYSTSGEGAQILKRISDEGNDCALYIHEKVYHNVFEGMLNRVDNPESFIDKDTIIIFDMSGNGKIADQWKAKGHHVFGASRFADDLEHDRNFGFDMMKQCGIKIPKYTEFRRFSDGIKFAQESKDRLVFKPNGSMPCKLTYVSEDSEQLVEYLKFVEKRFGKDIDSFVLQEFIEGVVVSSEAWYSNGLWVPPCNHTVEVKKSMNDDLGPSTGCSGNITWNDDSEIIAQGISKFDKLAKEHSFTGQIDLNAVVNESGVYGLEWTPRMGYDATPTYLTLVEEDLGEFFANMAKGTPSDNISTDLSYAGAIRISIPPYPMEVKSGVDTERLSPNEGIPIQDWEDDQGNLYFYEVMMENDILVHSGGTGVIALALSKSDKLEDLLDQPYDIADRIKIPDKQYRTDLQKTLEEMVKEVHNNG